jgi:peptide/nickel transport system substrate-binding protein
MVRDPVTIAQAKASGNPFVSQIQNAGGLLLINNGVAGTNPPTKDIRLRQAIAEAIDPNVINQRAFGGKGLPTSGLINGASKTVKATQGPKYDPVDAKKLVDQVKAEGKWDGSIRLLAVSAPPSNLESAITIQALLQAVDFKVTLNSGVSIQQFNTLTLVQHDYDLAVSGMTVDEASLWDALRQFDSRNPLNSNGYSSPDMDAALTALKTAQTQANYQAAIEQVQAVWNKTYPSAVYTAFEPIVAWQPSLQGLIFSSITPYFDKAYIKQ